MALNLALVISGDSQGAKGAVADTTRGVQGLGQAAREANVPLAATAPALDAGTNAAGRQSAAYERLNRSLSANVEARRQFQSFQTANIAAQFQDIIVTAQAGQSIEQIALQQGTQLSMALGNGGLRGTLLALGGALTSLLNPVSLLTVGAVALGALGIQAFTGMTHSAEDTAHSLEKNKQWLDEILSGYKSAKTAADQAAESAKKLPQGVVQSDLGAGIVSGQENVASIEARLAGVRADLANTLNELQSFRQTGTSTGDDTAALDAMIGQIEQLSTLSASTGTALDGAMTAVRELQHSAADPALSQMAGDVYDLQLQLRQATGEINSTTAALAALNNEALQGAVGKATDTTTAALDELKKLAPDLRSERQRASDALNTALGASPDALLRTAAQQQYDRTIAALDAQDRLKAAQSARGRAGDRSSPEEARQMVVAEAQIRVQQEAINAATQRQADLLQIATSGAEALGKALGDGKLEAGELWTILSDVAKQLFSMQGSNGPGSTVLSDFFTGIFGGATGLGKWNIPSSYQPGGFFPGLAGGGRVISPGLAIVGEQGPELMTLPAGASVTPHDQSMALLGRRGDTHNWFVETPSPRSFAQSRATLARTAGRLAASSARYA